MQISLKFTPFVSDVLNKVKTVTVPSVYKNAKDQDKQNNNLTEEYSLLGCSVM
jgi:hypothetical protein